MGVVMNVLVPYMLNANECECSSAAVLTMSGNWGLKTAFFYLGIGAPFAIGSWFIIPETTGCVPGCKCWPQLIISQSKLC